MKQSLTLSPPNSLILVMDHNFGTLPELITADLVAATDSCLAIGTLASPDGETTITLTNDLDNVETDELVFEGVLLTPNKELSICNVMNEKLLTLPVSASVINVKIFANDSSEPDQIVVLARP